MSMKYGDRIIRMKGHITEVQGGAVAVEFDGRLGHMKVPLRMIICDEMLEVGQEVYLNMSFLEVVNSSNKTIQKKEDIYESF